MVRVDTNHGEGLKDVLNKKKLKKMYIRNELAPIIPINSTLTKTIDNEKLSFCNHLNYPFGVLWSLSPLDPGKICVNV